MFRLIVFNKPMNVLTRFTDDAGRDNLSHYIAVPGVYPVGRLDQDSEGLLVLTDRGSLVEPLLRPGGKVKTYLVCVEGEPTRESLTALRAGPMLKDGKALPCEVEHLPQPPDWLWERVPPIRFRKSIPVSWLKLSISEGRNRQVRRMTAAVGLPTLRLVRLSFGSFELGSLGPGEWREATQAERSAVLSMEKEHSSQRAAVGKRRRAQKPSGPSKKR